MKIPAVLAALLSFIFLPVVMAEPAQSNDEAGVRIVVHGFEDAWNHHDMSALASLFAPDADFVNVIGMRWIGRETIKQAHAATHATIFKNSTLTIGDTTVRFLTPDIAIARSVWSLSGQTDRGGKEEPTRTGILTHVLTRAAGNWVIVASQNTGIVKPNN
jgi:uncharacterized protein (TIGR02246 family)